MIDHINQNLRRHIITVEDPIEVLHRDNKSVINQREIGLDTDTYVTALKYVLRQDPDVILIGEMRDAETVSAALTVSASRISPMRITSGSCRSTYFRAVT